MVSIIVPCYNCEKTFERCIASICGQSKENIEIILVDDGSTDATYQLCETVAQQDPRIKVIHQINRGLVAARKVGIREARGEYVAFCDSDDYIDFDLIEKTEAQALKYKADIIAFGMTVEYEDGSTIIKNNRLSQGYYSHQEIQRSVLPTYFSNGKMGSNVILHSVCSKIIRRTILLSALDVLNEKITNGEDAMIVFTSVLLADSLYCMDEYFPYHYWRNNNSMIGKYDADIFNKRLLLRDTLIKIAQKYDYKYLNQIEADFFTNILMDMKKEICRNRKESYRVIKKHLIHMRENDVFENALDVTSIEKFDLKSKIFAQLVIQKRYFTLYVLTKIMKWLGFGKA